MEQAGHSQCSPIKEVWFLHIYQHKRNSLSLSLQITYRCMEDDVSYSDHPPSSGDYRPVAPKYGEYKYLPPQRWLHVLQVCVCVWSIYRTYWLYYVVHMWAACLTLTWSLIWYCHFFISHSWVVLRSSTILVLQRSWFWNWRSWLNRVWEDTSSLHTLTSPIMR